MIVTKTSHIHVMFLYAGNGIITVNDRIKLNNLTLYRIFDRFKKKKNMDLIQKALTECITWFNEFL